MVVEDASSQGDWSGSVGVPEEGGKWQDQLQPGLWKARAIIQPEEPSDLARIS